MKTNVAVRAFYVSCLIVPESKAFAPPPSQFADVMGNRGLDISRYQNRLQLYHCSGDHERIYDAITPWSSNSIMKLSSTDRGKIHAVRGAARTASRCRSKILSTSGSSEGGSTAGKDETFRPSGPGAGLIDLHFQQLKSGGFKVFLLFFLLGCGQTVQLDVLYPTNGKKHVNIGLARTGSNSMYSTPKQARAKDNDFPFSIRETLDGIRVLIGDESKNESRWEGVLDLSWGMEPAPFFRVDRIDVNEVVPYPGELFILNKLLDAIIDVNGERSVNDPQKLFLFQPGEQRQLADAKAKLANLASL